MHKHTLFSRSSDGYHCVVAVVVVAIFPFNFAARRRLCHLRVYTLFIVYVYQSMLSNVFTMFALLCFFPSFLSPSMAFNLF